MNILKKARIKLEEKVLNNYKINYKNKGIINFIDVGSKKGLPFPWKSNAFLINNLLCFEPNEKAKKTGNIFIYDKGLWEEDCKKEFFIYKGLENTGSSLFEQNFEYVNNNWDNLKNIGDSNLAKSWHERSSLLKKTIIECRSLDNVLEEVFQNVKFHFLKVDAQGAEYNILKGGVKFLKEDCIALHLELFNKPLYKGIRLFEDVDKYLSGFGFSLVKKFSPHGTFNSQNDCLYLKNNKSHSDLMKKIMDVYKV